MKDKIYNDRVNVPCSTEFKNELIEIAKKEGEHMTVVARRWLRLGKEVEESNQGDER